MLKYRRRIQKLEITGEGKSAVANPDGKSRTNTRCLEHRNINRVRTNLLVFRPISFVLPFVVIQRDL